MEWKKGVFHEFRATQSIHLGALQIEIDEDEIVEFDGSVLRMKGEEHSNMRPLRGGFKMGWIVPASDNTSVYTAQPAGVQVRPAVSGNPRDARKAQNESRMATIQQEDQNVGTFNEGGRIVPKQGISPDRIQGQRNASKGMEVVADQQEAEVVGGSFKTVAKNLEPVDATTHSPQQIDKMDLSRRGKVSKSAVQKAKAQAAQRKAKPTITKNEVVLSNGMTWDMALHWKKRASLAVEQFQEDPETLEAIWAVESPGARKELEKHMT